MTAPRYETAMELMHRLGHTDTVVCTDCGSFVMDTAAHDQHHAALQRPVLTVIPPAPGPPTADWCCPDPAPGVLHGPEGMPPS